MPSSLEWRIYYEENARSLLEVPWQLGPELTLAESAAIARSLREFQAGESSEGSHLYRYAQEYSQSTGDHEYLKAIRLFIAEEQRHARDLGRFLKLNGIELVKTTFTDRVFRKLRHLFGGLEISISVLITAEIIAKVYYAVLRQATRSKILRRLCRSDSARRTEARRIPSRAACPPSCRPGGSGSGGNHGVAALSLPGHCAGRLVVPPYGNPPWRDVVSTLAAVLLEGVQPSIHIQACLGGAGNKEISNTH